MQQESLNNIQMLALIGWVLVALGAMFVGTVIIGSIVVMGKYILEFIVWFFRLFSHKTA